MRKKAPAKAEKAEAKKIEKAQKLDKATLKSSKSKGKAAGQAPANAFALSALADGKK